MMTLSRKSFTLIHLDVRAFSRVLMATWRPRRGGSRGLAGAEELVLVQVADAV
jgi:hypothetical protein